MEKIIYCFKNGILLQVAQPVMFENFIWKNFKLNDEIFIDGELFGTFDSLTINENFTTIVINL